MKIMIYSILLTTIIAWKTILALQRHHTVLRVHFFTHIFKINNILKINFECHVDVILRFKSVTQGLLIGFFTSTDKNLLLDGCRGG